MVIRVVQFQLAQGKQEQFRDLEQEILQTNREFGAITSYVLYPSDEQNLYGVISIWAEKDKLEQMRSAAKYQDLLTRVKELTKSQPTDLVYQAASL